MVSKKTTKLKKNRYDSPKNLFGEKETTCPSANNGFRI